jgi:hypothetical protein
LGHLFHDQRIALEDDVELVVGQDAAFGIPVTIPAREGDGQGRGVQQADEGMFHGGDGIFASPLSSSKCY